MKRLAAALIITLTALVPFQSSAAEKQTLFRLSFSGGWHGLPAIVAIERGFFAQQNIVVSGLPVSSPLAIIQSLSAGTTDFATVPQRTMLVMAAAKIPVKVVSMNGYGVPIELVVPVGDKRTKSLKDLKGKKIGIGRGSEAYPVLIRMLNAARMRPTDVKLVAMSARGLTTAFKRKVVSAVFETRHFTTTLVARKEARVALNNKNITDALGRIGAMPLVVNARLLKNKPQDVQRFVNAWVKALAYIQQNPKDATRIMRIYFHRQGIKVAPKLANFWVRIVRYDRYYWTTADIKDAEYNGWGLKTGRVLKVAPKLTGYIDNRFAKKAFAAIRKK